MPPSFVVSLVPEPSTLRHAGSGRYGSDSIQFTKNKKKSAIHTGQAFQSTLLSSGKNVRITPKKTICHAKVFVSSANTIVHEIYCHICKQENSVNVGLCVRK